MVHGLEGEDVVGSPDNNSGEVLSVLGVLGHQPRDAQAQHARLSQGSHEKVHEPKKENAGVNFQ